MRLSVLIAALSVVVPFGLCAVPASAQFFTDQSILFGRRHVYEGAWCAREQTGGGRVEEDCTFDSFEACRQLVVSGNRGFCMQNPAFRGYQQRPPRAKKRRAQ